MQGHDSQIIKPSVKIHTRNHYHNRWNSVREILGYPTLLLISDARIPAVSAPTKAAPAGGMAVISTISSRRVFAMAPIPAAVAASRTGLLNIIENPNTPQKLVIRRSKIQAPTGKDIFRKSTGYK